MRAQQLKLSAKLLAMLVVSVLLGIIIVNAIRNPVDGAKGEYTADFTDVSGLHVNGDVRVRGMRVGKVDDIELGSGSENVTARVTFSLDEGHRLTEGSTLAVKYQSLTGVRYVDLVEKAGGKPITHLNASDTKPSFDITALFNGLQPVLTTMRADEVNAFTANAIALIQGDGSGLGPMLESPQKLTRYARDRQQLISTLVDNLGRINDTMGGRAGYVVDFLHALTLPIDNAISVIDAFQKTADNGPALLAPVDSILQNLGITENIDWEAMLGKHFTTVSDALHTLEVLPGTVAGLQSTAAAASKKCRSGKAVVPDDVKVLMSGSEVTLCRTR